MDQRNCDGSDREQHEENDKGVPGQGQEAQGRHQEREAVMRAFLTLSLTVLAIVCMLALGSVLADCAQPGPVVTLGPSGPLPDDRFAGKVYSCSTDAVVSERDFAEVSVQRCLADPAWEACVLGLSTYSDATIACALREAGIALTVMVIEGDDTKAPAARAIKSWIVNHNLGFK
jgi:hypothetical protein